MSSSTGRTKTTLRGIRGLTLEATIAKLPEDAECRFLRKELNRTLIDLNTFWGRRIAVFESGCHLDCVDGFVFNATGVGVNTYALNLATNDGPEREKSISEATLANYQKNDKGGWIWNKRDMYMDCINILAAGVKMAEEIPISADQLECVHGLRVVNHTTPTFSSSYLHS
jgi:hypothetical protein